jgi:type IX secretion system PorP/SprF family membrane protein
MNLRKVIHLTVLALLFPFSFLNSVQGQQEPNFSQYMFYGLTLNPAAAGNENAVSITAADRIQWTGLGKENGQQIAPRTYFVAGDLPVRVLKGGVGMVIMNDAIGYENNVSVRLGYANQRKLGFGKLGIGTQLEFNNKSIDFGKLKPAGGSDPVLTGLAKESEMLIDFSLGVLYSVPGSYYVGLSGLHLIQTKGKPLSDASNALRMRPDRTFIINGGYEISFPRNPDYQLVPSAIIETDFVKTRLDVDAILRYKEVFWGGVGYRLGESIIILLGVQYKDFRIGYSYDISLNVLGLPIYGGTHEIMLNYRFKLELEKGRKSYKNTRFL